MATGSEFQQAEPEKDRLVLYRSMRGLGNTYLREREREEHKCMSTRMKLCAWVCFGLSQAAAQEEDSFTKHFSTIFEAK